MHVLKDLRKDNLIPMGHNTIFYKIIQYILFMKPPLEAHTCILNGIDKMSKCAYIR